MECLEDRSLPDAGLPHLLTLPREDFISGVYSSLLDRAPNSQESSTLTQNLALGLSRTDAIARILATREYDAHHPGGWLGNLYEDVLGRTPDARGRAAWNGALKDGLSRQTVAGGVLHGREFQALVAAAYADAAGAGAPNFETQSLGTPLLVQLKEVAGGLSRVATIARRAGASAEPTDVPGLFRVNGSDAVLAQLAESLPRYDLVRYVEAEQTVRIALAPNDPGYTGGSLYGLNGTYGVNAPAAWNTTTGSTRVTVAVIDTGVDYNHPDLFKNLWLNQGEVPGAVRANLSDLDGDGFITFWDLNDSRNQGAGKITDLNTNGRIDGGDLLFSTAVGGWANGVDNDGNGYIDDLVGWNFVANNNRPFDDQGHGTHVAGTIGAIGNNGLGVAGVNWRTQIMALKFIGAGGTGEYADAAAALRYAADNGARVSNNSWGGPDDARTVRDAISYAGAKRQIVVAAAGNDGRNISVTPEYPAAYHLSNMIVVAATNSAGQLASFSNYSATLVDVAAPGVDIYSTLPGGGYGYLSGTSMATPHVAGLAALVQAAQPGLTMAQVIGRVVNNATPLSSLSGRTVTGGLVDAARAVGSAAPGVPATPGTPTWSPAGTSNGYLSWGAVGGATGYRIQVSDNGSSWSQYATVSSPSAYVDAGYYYRVAAVNASGTSGYSTAVYASPQAGQPPATPGRPTWSAAGGNSITLYWNAVAGATGYEVQWWNSSAAGWVTLGTYSGTSVLINNGLAFYWRVRAVNSSGASGYSAYVLAGQAPDQPYWSWAGGSDINLFWNDVGASSYVVQYWSSGAGAWVTLGTYGGGSTSLNILYGYGYYWRVGAVYSTSNPVYSSYVLAE